MAILVAAAAFLLLVWPGYGWFLETTDLADDAQSEGAEFGVDLSEVSDHPDGMYGLMVTISGGILDVTGPHAVVIGTDTLLVGDIPTVDSRTLPTRLGGGPALVHKDNYGHYNQDLIWRLADVAEGAGIPVQHAVWEFFGSDGQALIQQGIPTALIGLSTRYTHSPFEMYDTRDFDYSLDLLKAFLTTPGG
jgi:hypothetical protein